ncbi:hypothetical protein K461DRAFT_231011 [Myriangium duriaei CBS 260.36]|uniref:DUF2461 domain-containing protein n=1 Tax=Myriangium duriaei CBS 260.36 TaxID=1168546 RepID=A0A9P4IT98_9PEZI|nr:hypothetical protein K461DRAFT_231011 [Myriangium duriaei CBS 260.36]
MKRAKSEDSDSETPRPTKSQKRGRGHPKGTKNATPKKSPHFPKQKLSDATGLTSEESTGDPDDEDESTFGSEAATSPSSPDEMDASDSEDDFASSSDDRKPKREELWRQGVSTGMAPGTEVVIKKPKARPAGKTPYADDRIHPNTLLFLGDLKMNNDREWLKMHDPDFRQSEKDFKSFIEAFTEKLIEVDDTVPELPVKDIIYRIYRDIRFSKDPTPYKPYFSAAWSRTGRKGPYAVYYLQISPGDSFFGGGSWHPESQQLARLRTAIDRRPNGLKDVLMADKMRREFLNGAPKSAEKVVKTFVSNRTNVEGALKSRPQGYDKDHPDIALLRLRNFTIGRKLNDDEVSSTGFMERVLELASVMKPFVSYLNSVVMPDPDAEDDEDEDEDDGEDGEQDEDEDEEDE